MGTCLDVSKWNPKKESLQGLKDDMTGEIETGSMRNERICLTAVRRNFYLPVTKR